MSYKHVLEEARSQSNWISGLRRRLHRFPELMFEEVRTSKLVKDTLSELEISFRDGIAETGVLATIGNGDGPCVALRADMDALPIHEEADIDFRSEVDGKMHACGHDCHTAMLLGAAKLLKARESELKGTVKLLFQPAEEGGAGGKRMSEEGVLEAPDVESIFGLHVWPQLPTGSIGSRSGTFLAASGEVYINVRGKGGHAAMPHLAIDPVVTAAKIITELQTIVSRELDPMDSAVISITTIHGGQAYNVIPPEVKLAGTIRALTTETINWLQNRVSAIAQNIAAANQCEADVSFSDNAYPPTVNDANVWNQVQEFAGPMLGESHVEEIPAVMGGEDFAFYTERVPGCFVALGIRNEEFGSTYSVHHPKFKVDEAALPIGSALHVAFAIDSLERLNS